MELDCDFADVVTSVGAIADSRHDKTSFSCGLAKLTTDQLERMANNLENSVGHLTGRGLRTARQQLALVRSELENRSGRKYITDVANTCEEKAHATQAQVPPQFNTPEARARRLQAIRAYHNKRKGQIGEVETTTADANLSVWLSTLTKALGQEAERHEQAARNYARVPELFPLHIDHSARAFELKRVLDLLGHWFTFRTQDE